MSHEAAVKCWICGADADSREHLIKASDLKAVFGPGITQKAPFFLHNDRARNQAVGSIKSKALKYTPVICSYCNNERTQPHDRAWEKLSEYLCTRQPPIQRGSSIRLSRVFPGSVHLSMLRVHLFFLKQFGCLISEHQIPLALEPFARAILTETAHPKVHIAFWTDLGPPGRVGRTHVQTAQIHGQIVYAGWFYIVDRLAVNVMYAEPEEHRKGLVQAWHPSAIGKRVVVVGA
jgi:hypothetical protein